MLCLPAVPFIRWINFPSFFCALVCLHCESNFRSQFQPLTSEPIPMFADRNNPYHSLSISHRFRFNYLQNVQCFFGKNFFGKVKIANSKRCSEINSSAYICTNTYTFRKFDSALLFYYQKPSISLSPPFHLSLLKLCVTKHQKQRAAVTTREHVKN